MSKKRWKILHADLYGTRGFFVEHIELDLGVKFQVSQTYSVSGLALPKGNFLALITVSPSALLGSYFMCSTCTSVIVVRPSFSHT